MHIIQRLPFLALLTMATLAFGQGGTTTIHGKVMDASTDEVLPGVTIRFDTTSLGTRTANDGTFTIRTSKKGSFITAAYVGYDPLTLVIKQDQFSEVVLRLKASKIDLKEFEITAKAKKYRNRDNPAVALMRAAIDRKEQNRKEHLDTYRYERYDKVELALNNITDQFRRSIVFKKVKFIFDNVDTNAVDGKVNLGFFLRESLADVYYRKKPAEQKEYVRAEQSTRFPGYVDEEGLNAQLATLYPEVDFYDNSVNLLELDFISPLADIAPNIYEFYIYDTTNVGNDRCAHLHFEPRQKTDLAFIGELWIALDSTYALRKIQVRIPDQINLNWVNGMQIEQEFVWVETPPGRGLMLSRDELWMEFGLVRGKDAKTVLGHRMASYQKFGLDQPLSDSLFAPPGKQIRDPLIARRSASYWTENRHDTLAPREAGVYKMVDSLNHHRTFRRFMNTVKLVVDGYYSVGAFDVGAIGNFFNYNDIEGYRLRFGGRTNLKFNQHLLLEGYTAYGFKDKRVKGMAGFRYSFGPDVVMKYPLNQLRVWYQNDMQIPGQVLNNGVFQSLGRGLTNRMLYAQTTGSEYLREYRSGFSYAISAKVNRYQPAGVLTFDYQAPDGIGFRPEIRTTEAGIALRYAPNEKFYQAPDTRIQIFNKYPIIQLAYNVGLKGTLGGQYNYHSLQLKISRGYFLAPFGWGDAYIDAGRVFGEVPYPLLAIHRGNQSYIYQTEAYNLMNFFEFVSDHYAAINISHNFGGFFFNRVPLLKYLRLRENASFKALWGGLDAASQPNTTNQLLFFPANDAGERLTYTFNKQPYVEASVGISNIFKFLRVDVVRRFTYTSNPGITKLALRAKVQMEF